MDDAEIAPMKCRGLKFPEAEVAIEQPSATALNPDRVSRVRRAPANPKASNSQSHVVCTLLASQNVNVTWRHCCVARSQS